jgi:hypothetical protein
LRLLERSYPFFVAHTDSCARPLPSFRFQVKPLFERSLQVAASPCCIKALPGVSPADLSSDAWTLPRWLTRCVHPFLPLSHRPSTESHWVGCSTRIRSTTSERGVVSRLQSFDNLQASEFACHPGRSHRWHPIRVPGGRGVYVRAERGSLPPRASDMLAVRIG